MSSLLKYRRRLIESDMAVMAQSQKLQVRTAQAVDQRFISFAFLLGIWLHTIGHIGTFRTDVHMIEQMVMHKIIIALIIFPVQSLILVQVHGRNL